MTQIMLAGGKGTLGLGADGILHLVWAPGSMLELQDAAESVLAVQGLSCGRMLPLLIEITDVRLTLGARNCYLDRSFVSSVALVGATSVDRVVAAWMRRGDSCPQSFFTSRTDAVEWLGGLSVPDRAQAIPA